MSSYLAQEHICIPMLRVVGKGCPWKKGIVYVHSGTHINSYLYRKTMHLRNPYMSEMVIH